MGAYKQFNIRFMIIIIIGMAIPMSVNYIVDPYNIFHTKFLDRQVQQNVRFNKTEFLASNSDLYNSYLLGSSRIGTTETASLEKYIPGSKFYNYSVGAGTVYDDLENLKFLLKNKGTVKNIYLQIDIDIILTCYRYPPDNYTVLFAPHMLNRNIYSYKMSYLTILPIEGIIDKIKKNINYELDYVREDFNNTGTWYVDAKEEYLKKDPKGYVAKENCFRESKARTVKDEKLQENLDALKQIVDICNENSINLIVFTTPHNHILMDSIDIDAYMQVLEAVGGITEYWDFTGYNAITMDDTNYYETSHYRPQVGQMVAARIFGDPKMVLPNDFGIFVTHENLKSHMEKRRVELINYDNAKSR